MKKAAPKAKTKASSRKAIKPTLVKSKPMSKPAAKLVTPKMVSSKSSTSKMEKHLPMLSALVLALGVLIVLAALMMLKMRNEIDEQYARQLINERSYQQKMKAAQVMKEAAPTPTPAAPKPVMKRY